MLPSRSGQLRVWGALCFLLLSQTVYLAAQPNEGENRRRERQERRARDAEETSATALMNIPLPVGHEAKGLILPDHDEQGQLRARFTAGVARRLDQEHVQFRELQMMTFTASQTPELEVIMPESTLNLKTRVLKSQQRTSIKRADFEIAGDAVEFDSATRKGKLSGNVKMIIVGNSNLMPDLPR